MAENTLKVEGPRVNTRGAQVVLTGEAIEAARGGFPGDIEGNTLVKKALEADGTVADGSTPDGSTLTGKPAPDAVVTTEAIPAGETPATEGTTRVEANPKPKSAEKPSEPEPVPKGKR
jgi:hypothetical protein